MQPLSMTDAWLLSPEIALTGLALLVLVLEFFVKNKGIIATIAVLGLVIPGAFTTWLALSPGRPSSAFFQMLTADNYALFFQYLFLFIGVGVILASYDFVRLYITSAGEFYGLVLFSLVGAMLMASATELITIYISLELTSFPLYVMAGMLRKNIPGNPESAKRSAEAAIKYVLARCHVVGDLALWDGAALRCHRLDRSARDSGGFDEHRQGPR